MINKGLIALSLMFTLLACSPSTKEEALEKYRSLLENKTWCKIETKIKLYSKTVITKSIKRQQLLLGLIN